MSGVSQQTISDIETGTKKPTSTSIIKLMIALDVKFEDLVTFEKLEE